MKLVQILYAPGATFVGLRPTDWVLPLAAGVAAILLSTMLMVQAMGLDNILNAGVTGIRATWGDKGSVRDPRLSFVLSVAVGIGLKVGLSLAYSSVAFWLLQYLRRPSFCRLLLWGLHTRAAGHPD